MEQLTAGEGIYSGGNGPELGSLTIDTGAMANLDDQDADLCVRDPVDDAIGTLAHPVTVNAGKLFAPRRPRVISQLPNALDNALSVRLVGDGFDLAEGGGLDRYSISCHCA